MAHQTPIRVRFGELDPYRHVNHAVYVSWFEFARTEALDSAGFGLDQLQDEGFQLVVTSIEVRYRGAAVAGDECIVETEVAEARRASMVWRQRVMRNGDELVTGLVRIGLCDSRGRPTRPPPGLMERLATIGSTDG